MITNDQIRAMNITRVIYDRGVAIRLNDDGFWQFESQQVNLPLIQADNDTVQREYGLIPLMTTQGRMITLGQLPKNTATFLLSNRPGHRLFLDVEHAEVSNRLLSLHETIKLFDGFNQTYVLGAAIYHCKRMADLYCEVSASSAMLPGGATAPVEYMASSHPEPYYEFDAWLSAALRVYHTSRYILWHVYRGTGSIPASFEGVIKKVEGIPNDLKQRLEQSWQSFGTRITAYRDCIHHYTPLDFGMSTARATALSGLIWSTQMHIPDNPEARSKSSFRFDNRIDALTFAWTGTVEVVTLARDLIESIS